MILVTGANGLVGGFVCNLLFKKNIPFRGLIRDNSDLSILDKSIPNESFVKGDLLDTLQMKKLLNDIDTVIHCAAVISFNPKFRSHMEKVNIEGTRDLVNLCLLMKIPKFIFISSIAALGNPKGIKRIDENQTWTGGNKNSNYALTKHYSEMEVWRAQGEGLNVLIVNPSTILGPGNWNRGSSRLFKYVWEENLFYTNGVINYVDIRDVAEIVVKLLEINAVGERFIINAGIVDYLTFFQKIASEFGKKSPSIKAGTSLMYIALIAEKIKSLFTGNEPYVTKETIWLTYMDVEYDNNKVKNYLNYKFRNLEETIRWTCKEILENSITPD